MPRASGELYAGLPYSISHIFTGGYLMPVRPESLTGFLAGGDMT
jgi:hypothetical protein